ncbi:MAG: fimbria/pilus outer membrane usher protein [Pseudomonadota bacterium]
MVNLSVKICAWRLALASALLLPAALAAAPLQFTASADDGEDIILPRGPGIAGDVVDLYLEVMLNNASTRRVMHFIRKPDGHFYAWTQNLQDAGIDTDGLPLSQYVDLAQVPGLNFVYDELAQRMQFQAAAERLNVAVQTLNSDASEAYEVSASSGALVNYDLYGNATAGESRSLGVSTELRAFSGRGVLSSTAYSNYQSTGESIGYRRLDTTWSRSFQDDLLTLNVGDVVSGNLSWSRATRLGGIQLRRNFGLQPQIVTFPLPAFFGQAALPSSVELYMNGVRQYSGQIAPGPYQISGMPNINGAGQGQVVMTDALGRRSAIDFSYYNSSQLLRAGLSDWSAEIGAVRRAYGLDSFRYNNKPAAIGSYRQGITDWLTLETHAEASDGLYLGGVGSAVQIQQLGLISASYARSGGDNVGQQAGLTYSWLYRGFNFEIGSTRTFGDYQDVASLDSRAPPLRNDRVLAGLALGNMGNASINYTRLETIEDGRFRFAGLSYSLSVGRNMNLYANASRSFDSSGDTSLFAGLSWSFGNSTSANASWQHEGKQNVFGAGVSRAVSPDGGVGWNLRTQQGQDINNYQAEAIYRADWGQTTGGAYYLNGEKNFYAGLSGSLVAMDQSIFVTRRIDDAFALITTNGVANIPVQLENRTIGRTDASGHYLLTGLNAWQPNRISIDALDLPAQLQMTSVKNAAVPADRTGVVVDFGIHEVHGAVVTLKDAQGTFLPLGTRVFLNLSKADAGMVGYDGQVYFENLQSSNHIKAVRPDGASCTLQLLYPKNTTGVPMIGPLLCR